MEKSKPSIDKGAPFRLTPYMLYARFNAIHDCIINKMTSSDLPPYKDRFWRVREIVKEWNKNVQGKFIPAWVSCLDKSMMAWLNKYSCYGWTDVPRKPHPFRNEWHSISCGVSGIMFGIELVEGKDEPKERPEKEFNQIEGRKTKMVGLLLRMTKPLWNSGKVVVLDSGFCVLKGLMRLLKRGVYALAVIKKQRYWPRFIKGDDVKQHMEGKEVGTTDALPGCMDKSDFHIFAMKENQYTMMLMSTYGGLTDVPGSIAKQAWKDNNNTLQRRTFTYQELFHNHYAYMHCVDDHNNRCQGTIFIEDAFASRHWGFRVFTFLLSLTEVNVALAHHFFTLRQEGKNPSQLNICQDLAIQMLNNTIGLRYAGSTTRKKASGRVHELVMPPLFTGRWLGDRWNKVSSQYLAPLCASCKKMQLAIASVQKDCFCASIVLQIIVLMPATFVKVSTNSMKKMSSFCPMFAVFIIVKIHNKCTIHTYIKS